MEAAEKINWFLNFAETDLETLTPGDKAKLYVEVREIIFPWKWEIEMSSSPDWMKQLPKNDGSEYWDLIKKLHFTVRMAIEMILNNIRIFELGSDEDLMSAKFTATGQFRIDSEGIHFHLSPKVQTIHQYVTYRILLLFDGTSTNSLSVCPECDRLFFNPTKKNKIYCSNKCLYRVHSRKRREADPEAYRASQREIMRKKYEADRKKKLGSKVKVNHRTKKEG